MRLSAIALILTLALSSFVVTRAAEVQRKAMPVIVYELRALPLTPVACGSERCLA